MSYVGSWLEHNRRITSGAYERWSDSPLPPSSTGYERIHKFDPKRRENMLKTKDKGTNF